MYVLWYQMYDLHRPVSAAAAAPCKGDVKIRTYYAFRDVKVEISHVWLL